MLAAAKNLARRWLVPRTQSLLRRRWHPILLPHHQLTDTGLSTLGAPPVTIAPELLAALKLCDGSRTLAEVCAASGISARTLVEQDHAGTLLLWPWRPWLDPRPESFVGMGIVLSPHLDDAALSMGAAMLAAGNTDQFTVIDVFSRVSWWRFDLRDEILPRVQLTRDSEEDLVMRLTNSDLHRWGLAECGYPLKEIFTTLRKPEAVEVHAILRARIKDFASATAGNYWYLPLGIGNHIDHRIARDAALDGLRDAGIPARQVHFYEDLPYAAQQPGVQDFTEFLAPVIPGARLDCRGSTQVTRHKQRLLRIYWSQLTASQIASVHEYARRVGGRRPCERLWQFDGPTLARTNGQIPVLGPLV